MEEPRYALVGYVRNALGKWVEELRTEVHPQHDHSAAHITILPPRLLQGDERHALEMIEEVCRAVQPFKVVMGEIQTFMPLTPTVFIRVAHGAYRLRELHDKLNLNALNYEEPWPYMPHLTIAKLDCFEDASVAAEVARSRWEIFSGSRDIQIEELTFVRESQQDEGWIDLAPIALGQSSSPAAK